MRGPEHFQSHHSVSLTLRLVSPGYWQPGCFFRCRRFLWAASSMPAAVCGGAGMWDHNIPLTRKPTSSHFFLAFFFPFPENIPRETLMHFAVRLGLLRLTWFLLQQPGGRGALSIHNNEGATPVSLALERGYQKLHQLLTE